MRSLVLLALCAVAPARAQTPDRALLPVATVPPVHRVAQAAVGRALQALGAERLARFYPPSAVGRPGHGRLLFGVRLTPSPGIHLRNPDEAWTLPEVIVGLRAAAAAVHAAYPGSVEMIVGDIALPHGGRFPPHHTHRNGRDVDLRYWIRDVQPGDFELHFVTPESFDPARNWTFVKALYDGGLATDVYIDVKLQKLLYRYATKALGLAPEAVEPILSWPKAARRKSALVKHRNGHYNHVHVRFSTPLSDFFGAAFSRERADAIQRDLDLARDGHFELEVKSGDTLGSIARAHDVSLDRLMAWNRVGPRTVLRPGRKLKIYAEKAEGAPR